jgi:hypothetical protein
MNNGGFERKDGLHYGGSAGHWAGLGACIYSIRANVVGTAINAEKLKELEGVEGITLRVLNVLDRVAVDKAIAEIGRIDVPFTAQASFTTAPSSKCRTRIWNSPWTSR